MQRSLASRLQIVVGVLAFITVSVLIAVFSHQLEQQLGPVATKLQQIKAGWLIICALIALISIPPLFGHELLAAIAGFVYGTGIGFAMVTISSIVGETFVYFGFRYLFKGQLDRFRHKYKESYGVFVAVVEDGGLFMLFLIRMSIIPPHLSTPLFSSLDSITWWRWMAANVLASPVKFFPPVYLGVLLRDQEHSPILGKVAFGVSMLVTVGTMWFVVRAYKQKKQSFLAAAQVEELAKLSNDSGTANTTAAHFSTDRDTDSLPPRRLQAKHDEEDTLEWSETVMVNPTLLKG
jgi:uncharacterized membrane protein YdjX (TVP38/TMEM64 family)